MRRGLMALVGLAIVVGLSTRVVTAIAAVGTDLLQPWLTAKITLADKKRPSSRVAKPKPDRNVDNTFDQQGTLEPFDRLTKHTKISTGLFTLYQHSAEAKAYLGIQPNQLNQNLLLVATLQAGLGEAELVRGLAINDLVVQFQRIPGNRLQLVVPNLRVRQAPGQPPNTRLLQQSFSDSLVLSLDILSIHPRTGEMLIDLKDLFITQDPVNLTESLSDLLADYDLDRDSSYLGEAKVFPANLDIPTTLGFLSSGNRLTDTDLSSLPTTQGFKLGVYYSLSALPHHADFQPRAADQRVGYFTTAYRLSPRDRSANEVVRYINRWHLEKQDPGAALSPPQKPLVFWLENTIPAQYRQAIREGVEWWNEAFEQIGFTQAIEVRQMPNNADWDPADSRYNVIRWSESWSATWDGLGQTRVNPLTGEILDGDVLLDASLIDTSQKLYQNLVAPANGFALAHLCAQRGAQTGDHFPLGRRPHQAPKGSQRVATSARCLQYRSWPQLAFGALAIGQRSSPGSAVEQETLYQQQFLRLLAAHEVGHLLGLRHNFLGSTLLAPADLNNLALTHRQGMVSSVMDYSPANIAPPGERQGDYFTTRLGAYDLWAIEYGYRPLGRSTQQQDLQRIANRSGSPELAYATDEDLFDGLDPLANAWDLSRDPLHYAQTQITIARAIGAKLNQFSLSPGESFDGLRQRVDTVFFHYLQQALAIANYIGGERFNRTLPWNTQGQKPFEPVAAELQREALTILEREIFSPGAISLSANLVNLLAPDRWLDSAEPADSPTLSYPLYNRILGIQALVLSHVFRSDRLERLRDVELTQTGPDPLTLRELFDRVTHALWQEIFVPEAASGPVSSLRRGIQQYYLTVLVNLTTDSPSNQSEPSSFLESLAMSTADQAPEDARALAHDQMGQLQSALSTYLQRYGGQLDGTNRAYLQEVSDRLRRILHRPL